MDLPSEIFAVLINLFGIFLCFLTEILNNIRWWFFPTYNDLTNDVVLITGKWIPRPPSAVTVMFPIGAGNGIGRLMCVEFAKYCPKVVAWDYQEHALEETASMVGKVTGHSLHTYVCDLR